jgi:hypothetical protein
MNPAKPVPGTPGGAVRQAKPLSGGSIRNLAPASAMILLMSDWARFLEISVDTE